MGAFTALPAVPGSSCGMLKNSARNLLKVLNVKVVYPVFDNLRGLNFVKNIKITFPVKKQTL